MIDNKMQIPKKLQKDIIKSVFGEDATATSKENDQSPLYLEEETGEYILIKPNGKVIRRRSKTQIRDLCKAYNFDPPDVFKPIRVVYDPLKPSGFQKDKEGLIFNTYCRSIYKQKHKNQRAAVTSADFPTINKLLENIFTDQKVHQSFLNWLAVIFNTGGKTCTAWVIVGPQGSGKNTLFNHILKPLIGADNCQLLNQDALESRYNKLLKDHLLVCFNEVSASQKGQDRLKTWITEDSMVIEGKGKDSISQDNPTNFIFLSNHKVPVVIEKDDRRFSVVKTGSPLRACGWFKGDSTIKTIKCEIDAFATYIGSFAYSVQDSQKPVETEFKNAIAGIYKNNFQEFSDHLKNNDHDWFLSEIEECKYNKEELSKLSDFEGSLDKDLTLKAFRDIYDEPLSKTKLSQQLKLYDITEIRGPQKDKSRKRQYVWCSLSKNKKVGQVGHEIINKRNNYHMNRLKTINQEFQPKFKRIIITQSAQNEPYTQTILSRVKKLYPNMPISQLGNDSPPFPSNLSPQDKYWYSKESLVLTTRKGPFCKIFPSPGDVVENLGTLLILGWHCESTCDFCYLQNAQIAWKQVYTNINELPKQIETEVYVYRSALVLWCALSFYRKETLYKVPPALGKEVDKLRMYYIKKGINSDQDAVIYIKDNISKIFEKVGEKVTKSKMNKIVKMLPTYYDKNKGFRPRLNISEYTDIIAIDPISGFMNHLMKLLSNYPDVDINLRTQSSHVDEMLKYNGNNQVRFTMNFNTPYVITNYENGTASLDKRIEAAQKVQNAKGYRLKIIIEPIIYYSGCEKDYLDLAKRIMTELDSSQIEDISYATVRYKKSLITRIKRNYPTTDLFDKMQPLEEPVKPDSRYRYNFKWRVSLFKQLKNVFQKNSTAKIRIGGDVADVWKAVGLNKSGHIKDSVYQYPGV